MLGIGTGISVQITGTRVLKDEEIYSLTTKAEAVIFNCSKLGLHYVLFRVLLIPVSRVSNWPNFEQFNITAFVIKL